jgi:hypothetical protein
MSASGARCIFRKATWSSGPHHGATTANVKRYMDFAAVYGFGGVLERTHGCLISSSRVCRFNACMTKLSVANPHPCGPRPRGVPLL